MPALTTPAPEPGQLQPDRPLPGETLEAVLKGVRLADPLLEFDDGRAFAFVPKLFELKDITDPHRLPPSIHQRITVDDAQSLIDYANRFSDSRSVIIADLDGLVIGVALDWHSSNCAGTVLEGYETLAPQPAKHLAALKLRTSEEFARWAGMESKLHDQMTFAEFLDENSSDIVDPDPAVMIEIARDLEATQGVKFKAGTRLQTGERSFSYETETHVKGDLKVPQRFWLAIPLFHGEEPTEIEASFRFRPNPDGLKLGFVWRRVEFVRQAKFREIAHRVAEMTGLPVFHGRAS
jgi:uncharacterized protein YfdQ (DUF2303 family)